MSLIKELTNGGSAFGPLLLLYGPSIVVGGIASIALSVSTHRDLGTVFLAATTVWALGAAGLLLTTGNSISENISHAVGFYGMWLGVAAALTGGVVAFTKVWSSRGETAPV